MTVAHDYRLTFTERNCTATIKQDKIALIKKGMSNEGLDRDFLVVIGLGWVDCAINSVLYFMGIILGKMKSVELIHWAMRTGIWRSG